MVSTSRKEVRRPSAVIANNNSIEAAFDNKLTNAWGKKPAVLAPKKTMKPRRKSGTAGKRERVAHDDPFREIKKAIKATTGTSIATRNSLTMTAKSPASSDTL